MPAKAPNVNAPVFDVFPMTNGRDSWPCLRRREETEVTESMTLLEAIEARHSVRRYLDKEIPADVVALQDKIAECNKLGKVNRYWII